MIFNYDGLKIYYITKGKGNEDCPLIFLHGWEGSSLSFKYFFEKMGEKRFCINLDFPPFGNSSMLEKPLKVEDYANIIIKLLKSLNVEKVDIVAHSFGGRVAIYLASQTLLVNKMLLTGCAGLKKRSFLKWFKIKKFKFLSFLARRGLYDIDKLKSFGSEEYKKLNPVMKQTFTNIVNYDQKKQLCKIKCPTLLVWGSLDKETPFYFTKIFKNNIKECEVIKFEKSGHFAYLENVKLFLYILLSFFC